MNETAFKVVQGGPKPMMVVRDGPGASRCTFEISVKFQQNSSWQGQILWAEKNMKQNFRSVLEMLRLMDEALTDGAPKSCGWEDKE
ncbi:MAG: hypothetical protein FWB75_02765 [Oscillospiraceae bacterium]|nr:hypothetical protein [Oscillospiraceae bacterium]